MDKPFSFEIFRSISKGVRENKRSLLRRERMNVFGEKKPLLLAS